MDRLIQAAQDALENSYCPYSEFAVGAALETEDGAVYIGVNMENINFSGTIHAEGGAFYKAVSDGYRPGDFERIAISSETEETPTPCGRCRQTMAEFCEPEFDIILEGGEEYTLAELLPEAFEEI